MIRYAVAIATLALAPPIFGLAAGGAAHATSASVQLAQATPLPVQAPPIYIPPRRGAPADVAPAATRSPNTQPRLKLLAPDHVALTVTAQPTLYMYVLERGHLQVLVARKADGSGPTVASGRVEIAEAPAIRPLAMADLPASLEPGVEYRVTLMFHDRSGSVRATESAVIRRVAEPVELTAMTAGAAQGARARAYASAGIWFDALDAASRAIAAAPTAPVPRQDRAALLDQAGLPEIANFDRAAAPRP